MAIKIGHASIDERNRVSGGKSGDQTGKEVCRRIWYSKPWSYVLRCKDSAKAEQMAQACEMGCANSCIGYDQYQRNTLYTQAKRVNFDLSKIITPCETDCSAFMSVCAQASGIAIPYNGTNAPTTSTMKAAFTSTGMFEVLTDSKYLTSDKYLKRGDILVKPGSHTVMALENGNCFTNSLTESSAGTKVTYITHRIPDDKWGNEITGYNLTDSMGYSGVIGKAIDKTAIRLSEGSITYTAHRTDGRWGGEITGYSTSDTNQYAGSGGKPIDAIAMKASGINGTLKYRVHRKADMKWGNWITGYSKTDSSKYAGIMGRAIDAIQIGIDS